MAFCPLSLYGLDVKSRQSLLQDPWSGVLRTPVRGGVGKAVRIDCSKRTEEPHPGRKLPFTADMVAPAIIFHRARDTVVDRLVAVAFRCGFCHLLRASEYLNPSGSKLSRHCILAQHVVFQYRTGVGEKQLVSGADLRRLRIPYDRITVYKITVPSAKNDIYRTGRFHFGSANRPIDDVDICRELYDHAVSTDLTTLSFPCERQVAVVRFSPMQLSTPRAHYERCWQLGEL